MSDQDARPDDDARPGEETAPLDADEVASPLPAAVSVAATGALCGLLTTGLVWLAERGCHAARGTTNCGALGLPLLLLIVATTLALGVLILRRLMLPNAGLVALLGVCFMLVIVVGMLADRLDGPWALLVVPAITVATFLLARVIAERLR